MANKKNKKLNKECFRSLEYVLFNNMAKELVDDSKFRHKLLFGIPSMDDIKSASIGTTFRVEDFNFAIDLLKRNDMNGKLILEQDGQQKDISFEEGLIQQLVQNGKLKISDLAKVLKGQTVVLKLISQPPLVLIPKWIKSEHRMKEIEAAIIRYSDAKRPIPMEWVVEYNELAESLNNK